MKFTYLIKYCVLSMLLPLIITRFSFYLSYVVGPGSDGSGNIMASITILTTVIIVCTIILYDLINEKNK